MKLTARGASDEARQLIPVFDGREGVRLLMTRLTRSLAFVLMALPGCQAPAQEGPVRAGAPRDAITASPSAKVLPEVGALELVDRSTEAILQEIAESSEPEVSFVACGELLGRTATIRTSGRKTVAVLMAMLVTQLGAPASVDGQRWTLFCREKAGPGKLFRKGQPAEHVSVPKAPERPK